MMTTLDEKSTPITNVLTIARPLSNHYPSTKSVEQYGAIDDVESTHSLTPSHTVHSEKDHGLFSHSPLYRSNPSDSKQNINVYDTDVEACLTPQKTTARSGNAALLKSRAGENMECTMWPGQKTMMKKKKAMKRDRMLCRCMAGLDRSTRIWIKVLIALFVLGIAVGVGVSTHSLGSGHCSL